MAKGTKIIKCSCKHAFQDATYGLGLRVHNFARKPGGTEPGWRCTVCLNVKPATAEDKQDNPIGKGAKTKV
jgi:hypothetical protein